MRIMRFLDPQGQTHLGIDQGDKTAELLTGDLFSDPRPSGRKAAIAKVLAPLAATNIFCIGANYREHARETGMPLPAYPFDLHETHHGPDQSGRCDPYSRLHPWAGG